LLLDTVIVFCLISPFSQSDLECQVRVSAVQTFLEQNGQVLLDGMYVMKYSHLKCFTIL